MPITAGIVRITLRYTFLAQKCQTAMYFAPGGAAWLTATAAGGAEAWWNDVKTAWRATVPTTTEAVFNSVLFEEIGGSLGFGEYAIPSGESQGTRDGTGFLTFMPTYVAVGVKLTVGTRVTRPGQKRFPFAGEIDNVSGVVQTAFLALINTLADKYDSVLTMGAPVATGILTPQIVTLSADGSTVEANQEVLGHVTNPIFTSQVSRRPGHGS